MTNLGDCLPPATTLACLVIEPSIFVEGDLARCSLMLAVLPCERSRVRLPVKAYSNLM
jgi:hypothetical protein